MIFELNVVEKCRLIETYELHVTKKIVKTGSITETYNTISLKNKLTALGEEDCKNFNIFFLLM